MAYPQELDELDELLAEEAEFDEYDELDGEGEQDELDEYDEFDESEFDGEGEFDEFDGEGEFDEFDGEGEFDEFDGEGELDSEGELDEGEFDGEGEATEMDEGELDEVAASLLEVQSADEIEGFLPLLLGPALGALKGLAPVAMKAMAPAVTQLAGRFLPRLAGLFGGRRRARRGEVEEILGHELDGMSNEDAEFALARRYVGLVRRVGRRVHDGVHGLRGRGRRLTRRQLLRIIPRIVTRAIADLSPQTEPDPLMSRSGAGRTSGRWFRRGNRIIIEL